MASERQRSERLRHSERRGVTSSEAAAQRDAIGLVVIREEGHRGKVKLRAKVNDNIANAKKSDAARYLQLKSGHAITGAHLLRISKVEDA